MPLSPCSCAWHASRQPFGAPTSFNTRSSLGQGAVNSSDPASTSMRQVPQLASRHEKGIGASSSSHRSTRRVPAGALVSALLNTMRTTATHVYHFVDGRPARLNATECHASMDGSYATTAHSTRVLQWIQDLLTEWTRAAADSSAAIASSSASKRCSRGSGPAAEVLGCCAPWAKRLWAAGSSRRRPSSVMRE